jgi:GST-like protein
MINDSGEPYASRPAVTGEGKKILFGQTASRAPAA